MLRICLLCNLLSVPKPQRCFVLRTYAKVFIWRKETKYFFFIKVKVGLKTNFFVNFHPKER